MTQEYGDYSFKTELEAAQGYTVPAAAEVSIPQDPFQKMHDDMQKAFLQGGTLDQILEAGGTAEPEDTKKSNLVEIFNSDKPRAFQLIIAKNGGASQEITAFVLAHEGTINVDKDFHLSMQKESLPPDEQALIGERTDLFSETPISPASLTLKPIINSETLSSPASLTQTQPGAIVSEEEIIKKKTAMMEAQPPFTPQGKGNLS